MPGISKPLKAMTLCVCVCVDMLQYFHQGDEDFTHSQGQRLHDISASEQNVGIIQKIEI